MAFLVNSNKNLRDYFYGDYYPLTPSKLNADEDKWLAYQLNRPMQKDGLVIGFRRKMNMNSSITAKLSGLDKKGVYELYYEDNESRIRKTGSELMEGIELTIPKTPSSLLIQYKLVTVEIP
jgi:alpha-galactosidase